MASCASWWMMAGRAGSLGPGAQPEAERPAPPPALDAERQALWAAVVQAMPAGWFRREHWELLAMYCGHYQEWLRLDAEVAKVWEQATDKQGVNTDLLEVWQRMRDRERRAFSDLATKMRLTQQASYHPEKGKGPAGGGAAPPWASKGQP